MLTRREFLPLAAGSTLLTASTLMADSGPGSVMPTVGKVTERALPANTASASGKYVPAYRFGLGGVAAGNGFAALSDDGAEALMEASWAAGVRYYDTSPFYGFGLSERRFGRFLHNKSPEEYVLSTKIGRIFHATKTPPKGLWHEPSPFGYKYDYTAEGARRSIEDSLQRLGVSQIDIVFIHDLSPDNGDMKEKWPEYFEIAQKGAMPELTKMREEGLIKAWGFGVNRPEPALKAVEVADPDIFLLACQYSLIDHEQAVEKTLPVLEKKGVSVVVGAPLMAGYLAGRDRYLYGETVPEGAAQKREKLMKVASEYGIDLRTASLQFAAAPKIVSAVIPGARTPEQLKANADSMKVAIPAGFWEELRKQGLIAKGAVTPGAQV